VNAKLSAAGLQAFVKDFVQVVGIRINAHDIPVGVDEENGRNGFDIEMPRHGPAEIRRFHGVVMPDHTVFGDGTLPVAWILLQGDAENLESAVVVFAVQLRQVRVFGPAWPAPTAPELQYSVFSFRIAQMRAAAVGQGDLEIGGGFAGHETRLPVTVPDESDDEGDGEKDEVFIFHDCDFCDDENGGKDRTADLKLKDCFVGAPPTVGIIATRITRIMRIYADFGGLAATLDLLRIFSAFGDA